MSRRNGVFSFFAFLVVLCLSPVLRPRCSAPLQTEFEEDDCDEHTTYVADSYEEHSVVIGIDLGSTHSRVGVFKNGEFEIIVDDKGHTMTPSYVAFKNEGTLVGFAAKDQAASNPKNTIYDIRRLLGRRFSDQTLQNDIKPLLYDVVDKQGKPTVKVQLDGSAKFFTPERILSKILEKLKENAEAYLDVSVKYAVMTVPAYFSDEQRQAIKDAGLLAGLIVLRVINEPTAAGIGHGIDIPKHNTGDECIDCLFLVYDLGGRNCDLTLEEVSDGAFEILSMAGDRHLGGEEFDHALLNYVVDQYNSKNNANIANDFQAMEILKYEANKVEEALLTKLSARIEIQARSNINEFCETITQSQLHDLNRKLFEKTLKLVEQVLEEAEVKKSQVNAIILTGSPVHIRKIQPFLETYFDGRKFYNSVSPDEAVVRGAAIQAEVLSLPSSDEDVCDVVVTTLGLGIETSEGTFTQLIRRNSIMLKAVIVSRIFSTLTDNQSKVVLRILQGERLVASKNRLLGILELTGIPLAPRGVPHIDVAFEIDRNSVLTVVAREKESGTEARLVIAVNLDGYSDDQIDGIITDANNHYEDDSSAIVLATKNHDGRDEHRFGVIIRGGDESSSVAKGC